MNFKTLSAVGCIAVLAGVGCTDFNKTDETDTQVETNTAPIVNVNGATVTDNSVTFAATAYDAESDALTYFWDFGDGNKSNAPTPTHEYEQSDEDMTYSVLLTIYDSEGNQTTDTYIVTVPAYINKAPTVSVDSASVVGNSVTFEATANDIENDTLSYVWDFGDGNQSIETQPTHEYAESDSDVTYSVQLTIYDAAGNQAVDRYLVTVPANINAPAVIGSISTALTENTVTFNAEVSDPENELIASYQWYFGDGNTSTAISPTHSYALSAENKTYSVSLVVTDAAGNTTTESIDVDILAQVDIEPQNPVISSINTTVDVTGSIITFDAVVATPDGGEVSYDWSFGDGATAMTASPTHTFAQSQSASMQYVVTLTVTTLQGTSVYSSILVTIPRANIPVGLPASVSVGQAGVATFMANSTQVDDISYAWDFGDGNTSILENPVHSYAQDTSDMAYVATLVKTYSDSSTETQTVEVLIPANLPTVIDPIYTIGTKTIDTVSVNFASQAVDSDSSELSYFWHFNDGTTSDEENPVHVYTLSQASQTFSVSLDVSDGLTIVSEIFDVFVELNKAPEVAQIGFESVDVGESFTLSGTVTDEDDAVLWHTWSFDGRTFNTAEVTTSIANAGTYPVEYSVSDGINTVTQMFTITVDAGVSIGDESFTLLNTPNATQHQLFAINACGLNSEINNDEYLLVDGSMTNINNSWSHVISTATEWDNIAKSTSDYAINTGYTPNANCNNANSINNILVKKYTDWDHQHGNGFKFPMPSDNPTFAELGTITMDIYVDLDNSVLPTNEEVRAAYSGLTSAQLDELDDGEFYLDIQLNHDAVDPNPSNDANYHTTEGDIHGTINLSISRDHANQWVRVTVPVSNLIFREETADWGVQTVSYNDVKDLVPNDMSFVAETKSRNVYRHYLTGTAQSDQTTFENLGLPKLYKEQAIRIKYLEISKSDGTPVVLPPVAIDYSLNGDKLYKSGEIYTKTDDYLYGSIEVRMKAAKGSGIVNGYFTYKNGSEISGTPWEEIDMEVLGKNNAVDLQTNVITGTSAARITSEAHHTQVQSLADDFHVYRMDWYPDRVEFFLDGQMLDRAGKENMSVDQYASLTSQQGLRLNLWPANIAEWVGEIDDTVYPVSMEIDYMSYSSLDQNTGNFVLEWTDGFETIDSTRWGLANWTFGENDAKFNPTQVTTDGDILKITLDHYTGF